MDREKFLEILQTQLEGEIPSPEISQHLAYYKNYIDQKLREGRSESDVLGELGDPRLIAKTLIDTEDVPNVHGHYQSYAYSAEEASTDGFTQAEAPDESRPEGTRAGRITRKIAAIAAIILLVVLLSFVLRALIPVAAVLILAGLIISLIDRR